MCGRRRCKNGFLRKAGQLHQECAIGSPSTGNLGGANISRGYLTQGTEGKGALGENTRPRLGQSAIGLARDGRDKGDFGAASPNFCRKDEGYSCRRFRAVAGVPRNRATAWSNSPLFCGAAEKTMQQQAATLNCTRCDVPMKWHSEQIGAGCLMNVFECELCDRLSAAQAGDQDTTLVRRMAH